MDIWGTKKVRKPFAPNTKRIEWLLASGRDPDKYFETGKFYKTSYCRKCKRRLIWGDGSYDFDHKDNNSANNRQSNCYLVCKVCHGKHTKTKVIKERDYFGQVVGHKTIKLKTGYKKPAKKSAKKKAKKSNDIPWILR